LDERLHKLKHFGPDELLTELSNLHIEYPEKQEITNNLAYLEKRKQQMRYPNFQAQGWPIGSGMVESGNKLVVEVRLKGAGMHWAENNVNPMLAIRNILCSDRWKQDWPKIERCMRIQNALKRRKLRQSRANNARNLHWQPLDLPMLSPLVPKKSKPNPWRNFVFGKALFRHENPPKN